MKSKNIITLLLLAIWAMVFIFGCSPDRELSKQPEPGIYSLRFRYVDNDGKEGLSPEIHYRKK